MAISNYRYFSKGDSSELWILTLAPGTYGFTKAKMAVSLKNRQLSVIIASYSYDTVSYKGGDFSTYSGTITIYNEKLKEINQFIYEKGDLVQPQAADYTTSSLCGNCPPPPTTDWCVVYPPLCDYQGGGTTDPNDPTMLMMNPEDRGGGGGSGTTYSSTENYLISTLNLSYTQAQWIVDNPERADEMYNFLNLGTYSELTFEDKRGIAYNHLQNMMSSSDYLLMVQDYSASAAAVHPWMIELFKELAIEIGFKIVKKYAPGYSDWNSIKDAIQNGSQGDWLGMLGEVINIAKKKVPWLAAVDATIDAFDFGTLANKAWKSFNKIQRIPNQAFDGIIKTLKNKCGGILDKIKHDDIIPNSSQGLINYNPADAENFFREIASHIPNTTIHPTSSPGVFYFDVSGIRFTFYPISGTTGDASISLKSLTTNWEYKFRFY